jgi:hypothetical protein
VRIVADAFASGRPVRPLWLDSDNGVNADGAPIPVRYLVNGATIAQVQREPAR